MKEGPAISDVPEAGGAVIHPRRRFTRRKMLLVALPLALIAAGVAVFTGIGSSSDSSGAPATYLQASWTQMSGLEYCDNWFDGNLWQLNRQVVGCYGPTSGSTRVDEIADVSTDTGQTRWRWTEPSRPGTENAGVSLSATTEDGIGAVLLDYSAPGGGPNAPSVAMALAGIDTASGRTLWQTDLPSGAFQPSDPGIQVGGGYAVIGLEGSGTGMLVLDLHSGEVRWSLSQPIAGQAPNCGVTSYAISSPSLYVAEFCDTADNLKDTLVQYSLATGTAQGSTPMSSSICGPDTAGYSASVWSAPGYVLAACSGPAKAKGTGLDVITAGSLTQHTLNIPAFDTSLSNGTGSKIPLVPAFFIVGTDLYIETSGSDGVTSLGVADIDLSALRVKWSASASWGYLIGADKTGAIVQQNPFSDWNAKTHPVWLDHLTSGSGDVARGAGIDRASPGISATLVGDVLLAFGTDQYGVRTARAYDLASWMSAGAGGTS